MNKIVKVFVLIALLASIIVLNEARMIKYENQSTTSDSESSEPSKTTLESRLASKDYSYKAISPHPKFTYLPMLLNRMIKMTHVQNLN